MNEPMTDYQFRTLLKMVLEVLESSKDLQEAKSKIKSLLENEQS